MREIFCEISRLAHHNVVECETEKVTPTSQFAIPTANLIWYQFNELGIWNSNDLVIWVSADSPQLLGCFTIE